MLFTQICSVLQSQLLVIVLLMVPSVPSHFLKTVFRLAVVYTLFLFQLFWSGFLKEIFRDQAPSRRSEENCVPHLLKHG